MQTILTAFLAALAFALAQPARAATNLLPDGGFESGQWKLTKWDNGEGTATATVKMPPANR